MGWWLDSMSLEVFSNLSNSVMPCVVVFFFLIAHRNLCTGQNPTPKPTPKPESVPSFLCTGFNKDWTGIIATAQVPRFEWSAATMSETCVQSARPSGRIREKCSSVKILVGKESSSWSMIFRCSKHHNEIRGSSLIGCLLSCPSPLPPHGGQKRSFIRIVSPNDKMISLWHQPLHRLLMQWSGP